MDFIYIYIYICIIILNKEIKDEYTHIGMLMCIKRYLCYLFCLYLLYYIGLMISGFARAAQVLGDKSYLEKADKAAMFIKKHLFKTETCTLLRNAYRDTKGLVIMY